jgi:hypothetical protein
VDGQVSHSIDVDVRMRWGAPYVVKNTDGAAPRTRVIETFDWQPAPLGFLYPRIGLVHRNDDAIKATLQRLKVLLETRAVTAR